MKPNRFSYRCWYKGKMHYPEKDSTSLIPQPYFPASHFDEEEDSPVMMQSTGLTDKKREEIFEGDIIEFHDMYYWSRGDEHYPSKDKSRSVVEFQNGYFHIECSDYFDCLHDVLTFKGIHAKVIGNIKQNPELLKN